MGEVSQSHPVQTLQGPSPLASNPMDAPVSGQVSISSSGPMAMLVLSGRWRGQFSNAVRPWRPLPAAQTAFGALASRYNVSGARSAPFGQTMVRASGSTRTCPNS